MKKVNMGIILIVLLVLVSSVAYFTLDGSNISSGDITVTDMVDRVVTIPKSPDTIVSTSSPLTTIIYMLAPDKLSALSSAWDNGTKFVPDKYRNMTAVGAWHGKKGTGNDEALLSLKPDIIIDSPRVRQGSVIQSDLQLIIDKFSPIPIVAVPETANLTNVIPTYEFLGKLLNEEENANKLKNTLQSYLDLGAKTKEASKSKPKNVYYAQGTDGLTTSPSGSEHAQILDIIGACNVANITGETQIQVSQVSIEQVIKWNPEIIITIDENFYDGIYNSPEWASITAVKNKQVYLVPTDPYNWFDMPPGANTVIGIPWTLKVVYPEYNKDWNLKDEVREFYHNFYHYDLSDGELTSLLTKSGLKSF
ncbi:ABC transporter substrate-binding protein [Methanobrevibacter filiformis]|uniref:Vitamin B12-binding protein n=1 Tax=Methanobrevibacter filiformis TaxID=55758 RepID=A0A166AL47_9EURY|nr:ABC transporter substrate-binding protein [Methanobrevibacter filiformis]KZX12178.1 vitamin B12-binding protein [Methanobrevibacter filiformis]